MAGFAQQAAFGSKYFVICFLSKFKKPGADLQLLPLHSEKMTVIHDMFILMSNSLALPGGNQNWPRWW